MLSKDEHHAKLVAREQKEQERAEKGRVKAKELLPPKELKALVMKLREQAAGLVSQANRQAQAGLLGDFDSEVFDAAYVLKLVDELEDAYKDGRVTTLKAKLAKAHESLTPNAEVAARAKKREKAIEKALEKATAKKVAKK